MEFYPVDMEVYPGVIEAYPGVMEAYPRVLQVVIMYLFTMSPKVKHINS
jgi:hypothetical protein